MGRSPVDQGAEANSGRELVLCSYTSRTRELAGRGCDPHVGGGLSLWLFVYLIIKNIKNIFGATCNGESAGGFCMLRPLVPSLHDTPTTTLTSRVIHHARCCLRPRGSHGGTANRVAVPRDLAIGPTEEKIAQRLVLRTRR
jgi:hypothetical protein